MEIYHQFYSHVVSANFTLKKIQFSDGFLSSIQDIKNALENPEDLKPGEMIQLLHRKYLNNVLAETKEIISKEAAPELSTISSKLEPKIKNIAAICDRIDNEHEEIRPSEQIHELQAAIEQVIERSKHLFWPEFIVVNAVLRYVLENLERREDELQRQIQTKEKALKDLKVIVRDILIYVKETYRDFLGILQSLYPESKGQDITKKMVHITWPTAAAWLPTSKDPDNGIIWTISVELIRLLP